MKTVGMAPPVLPTPDESLSLRYSPDTDFDGSDFTSNRPPTNPQIHPFGPLPQIHPPRVLASCDADPPTAGFNEQGLMDEIAKLDKRRYFLLCQLEKQRQQQLLLLEKPSTSKLDVVAFVYKLQNAHHYFDFKDLLNQRYSGPREKFLSYHKAPSFIKSLHDLPKQLNMFNSLKHDDIVSAAHVHFLRLRYPKVAAPCSPNMDPATSLLYQLHVEDRYAFASTTFRFVFLSRHQVYDMDSCPERELEKMNNSPKYFGDCILFDELAVTWKETDAAVPVAERYEEACSKYAELRLRRSNVEGHCDPKIPVAVAVTCAVDQAIKEGSMSGNKRQRKE